jgi:hypothetical protein
MPYVRKHVAPIQRLQRRKLRSATGVGSAVITECDIRRIHSHAAEVVVDDLENRRNANNTPIQTDDVLVRLRELRRTLARASSGPDRFRAANALFLEAEPLYRTGKIGLSLYRAIIAHIDRATNDSLPTSNEQKRSHD